MGIVVWGDEVPNKITTAPLRGWIFHHNIFGTYGRRDVCLMPLFPHGKETTIIGLFAVCYQDCGSLCHHALTRQRIVNNQ